MRRGSRHRLTAHRPIRCRQVDVDGGKKRGIAQRQDSRRDSAHHRDCAADVGSEARRVGGEQW